MNELLINYDNIIGYVKFILVPHKGIFLRLSNLLTVRAKLLPKIIMGGAAPYEIIGGASAPPPLPTPLCLASLCWR